MSYLFIVAECLKIRNMFEPGDRDPNVPNRVGNAIQEWCKGLDGITSIDFAITDGVVYVKCTSKEKAGHGMIQILWPIIFTACN